MEDYMIRKANKFDIPEIQKVARTSWNAAYDGIIPREVQDNFHQRAYSHGTLSIKINRTLFLVAFSKKNLIGFISFLKEEDRVDLGALYLLPNFQGLGVGSKLLEKGMSYLKYPKAVYVEVEKENIQACKFYEKHGFIKIGEYDELFYGHRLKTVKMELKR